MAQSLVWLRNDLRLADNPALAAGLAEGAVVLVYVLDPAARWGGASLWWLHHSLERLGAEIAARGGQLVLRRGDSCTIIPALAREIGATSVQAGRAHEPYLRAIDREVAASLQKIGVAFHRHRSALALPPEAVLTQASGVYGVYTPFSRACLDKLALRPPIPAPAEFPATRPIASDRLADWGLLPTAPDWAGGLRATWQPGEAGAQAQLAAFSPARLDHYDLNRNQPGIPGTSMLSPHLHWGEIAIDSVWRTIEALPTPRHEGKQIYLKELLWREFAAYLLWHHPSLETTPMRAEFERVAWRDSPSDLRAWQRGMTGVPIVDAGMRQLWQTGWLHNRVRMIVASYLVKHLLIPWQVGAAWFWDTLVDADHASNAASWQWVAGSGADAAPYFRVFNPVLQGEKFDPDGSYVRRYIPELARLPDAHLHAPWQAPDLILRGAGVVLGKDYPKPLVDLKYGRERALAAFKVLGKNAA
ncbi:MAG: cryptochrome/photolyase family protein [Acidiphilium sp.]|jgi:deoxyribodipyrimidine photo-lyase